MTGFRRWMALLLIVGLRAAVAAPAAGEEFYLRDGQRIVFFGDSITQGGMYVEYFDAFLRTRFPQHRYEVINRGISSETISGTSEPDHDPRRPDAHRRFARDIPPLRPDVVVACFGMNDGNYHPFDEPRFRAYQEGVRRLIRRTREEAKADLVLMSPPPYDPYRRRASDPEAVHFGYKFAAIDYDHTLARYSQWLLTLREEGFRVADVHTASNQHLQQRRRQRVSFHLAPDAVHPGPTGHWLMAQTLLETLSAPAEADRAAIDVQAPAPRATAGEVSQLARDGASLTFSWRSRLPMPIDPRWDAESIALERVSQRLNRYTLTVTGLREGRYTLRCEDVDLGTFTHQQLAQGLDLTSLEGLPTNRAALEVLDLVQKRQRLLYGAWRKELTLEDAAARQTLAAETRQTADELDQRLRALCQPRTLSMALVPAGDE